MLWQWLADWWQRAVDGQGWLVVFGLAAQTMFMLRFAVQWVSSERAGRSIVPPAFWYFSLGGGALLLLYGILRAEPVIVIGQVPALLIYARNLHLIRRADQ